MEVNDITSGQSRKDVELNGRYRRFMGFIGSACINAVDRHPDSTYIVHIGLWANGYTYTCAHTCWTCKSVIRVECAVHSYLHTRRGNTELLHHRRYHYSQLSTYRYTPCCSLKNFVNAVGSQLDLQILKRAKRKSNGRWKVESFYAWIEFHFILICLERCAKITQLEGCSEFVRMNVSQSHVNAIFHSRSFFGQFTLLEFY